MLAARYDEDDDLKSRNVCVYGRERRRTAMIDTTWRQIYSEPNFLFL